MGNKKGWCITFYSDEAQIDNDNRTEIGADHLSWSPYDRMQITLVDNFKKFIFPEPDELVKWCGVKQQLHLVPVYSLSIGNNCDNDVVGYRDEWENKAAEAILAKKKNCDPYGLYCLVTVRLSDVIVRHIAESSDSIDIKLDIIEQLMNQIKINTENKELNFDCISFESLGSEDFALIMFANDIKTFFCALSVIRNQNTIYNSTDGSGEELFKSICTMTGFNVSDYNAAPNMKAFVKLNLKKKSDIFWNEFQESYEDNCIGKIEKYPFFQGKTTIGMIFQPKDLSFWVSPSGVFNGASSFYTQNIISSRTYWIEDERFEVEDNIINIKALSQNDFLRIHENIFEIRKLPDFSSQIKNPVARFIDSEYCRLLCLTRCTEWIDILKSQQDVFRACTEYYEKNNLIAQENSLLEEMQTVLTHINQACASISEVPYHNHYYSGSFNDILRMYYGIIDTIIDVGRSVPRLSEHKQSELAFGIKFESANKIHTTLYSIPDQRKRIAIFHLPYESLHSFRKNMELLVHEVFHYIAPINRKYRNKHILNVWLECIIEVFTEHLAENVCSDHMASEIRNYLNANWDDLCEKCYITAKNSISHFDKLELYDFTDNMFAKEILIYITTILKEYINTYIDTCCQRTKGNEGYEKYKLLKEKTKEYTLDYLIWRFVSKDVLLRMIEITVALKEVFCDLFMCSVFELDFEKYFNFFGLQSYYDNIKSGNFAVIYRINIIKYILETNYQETNYFNEKSSNWDKIKIDKSSFSDNNAKQIYESIKADSGQTLSNPQLYDALIKVLSYEINFLKNIKDTETYQIISKLKDIYNTKSSYFGDEKNDITQNIEMIHKCMNYLFVPQKMQDYTSEDIPTLKEESYSISADRSIWVYSLTDYIREMCIIANESNGEQLWYRGVCDIRFSLLPSLFRFLDDSLSLYANQVNLLKRAYSSTLQFPELWKGSISEQMCCLQHYGMPTNLLDFTLDMLVALHFAINPDNADDREKVDAGLFVPVVYVFNPQKYAGATMTLKDGLLPLEAVKKFNISPILYDIAGDDMTGFFPQKMDASKLIEHTKTHNIEYSPSTRVDKYPIPVIIRRSNSRILVQNGTFLAYNLDAEPMKSSKNKYQYLDLRKIEENYEDLLVTNGIKEQKFLEKVKINPCSVSSIRSDLKTLGISSSKMYPELQNIFADEKNKYMEQIVKSNNDGKIS